MDGVTFRKETAGLYSLIRGGQRIGSTATHPRVFPRHWSATIGSGPGQIQGVGKTRAAAVADALDREERRRDLCARTFIHEPHDWTLRRPKSRGGNLTVRCPGRPAGTV